MIVIGCNKRSVIRMFVFIEFQQQLITKESKILRYKNDEGISGDFYRSIGLK